VPSDGPVADILEAVEDGAGIPVTVVALPHDFAGAMRRDQRHVYIFVNGVEPHVRQRFTLAHELGHFRLGHATVFDTVADLRGRDPQEVEANEFAGEFLVPRAAIDAWMERNGDPRVDLELVVRVARHFGVSAPVARIRLEKAGRLRGRAKTQVAQAIAAREHTSLAYMLSLGEFHDSLSAISPSDLPRLPVVVQRQIKTVYAAGLASVEELATRTRQDPGRLATELAGVNVAEGDPDF